MKRHFITAVVAAAMASGAVSRAAADGGDFAAGLIIGGIGMAAINNANKNKKRVVVSSSNSAQREENRQVQAALNYFGFPAGTPDGVFGRKTTAAVSSYQAHMGYPITGELTENQKQFLLGSYGRAEAGGALTLQQISMTPGGAAGLLLVWRDEMVNGAQQGGQGMMAAAPAAPMPIVPAAPVVPLAPAAPAPGTLVAVEPAPAAPGAGTFAALPTFMADGTAKASLASHCNQVSLLTNTNGGFTTLASMGDPDVTLNEQFCLARTYAIATGEEMAQKVQGFTPAQIEAQCKGFGPAMEGPIGDVGLKPAAQVLSETTDFARSTGMQLAQLAGTAKICLSVGYRTDDLDTAIGSALLLTALGEQAYGELLGHHLMLGFGTAQRDDLARDWYHLGVTALESGATPVFAPGQPERTELIKAAVFGIPQPAPVVPAATAPVPEAPKVKTLPGFSIKN